MAKLPDLETWAKEAGERGAQYALKYLEEEYGVSPQRLIELARADREGRCVVLPCKFGGPVWRLYDDCDFPGDCYTKQKCRGCEYRNLSIEKRVFCLSMLSQNGKLDPPYPSIHEASDGIISRRRNITAVCNGKRKSAYGYIWRWGQRKIETVLPKSDAKDESLEAGHD